VITELTKTRFSHCLGGYQEVICCQRVYTAVEISVDEILRSFFCKTALGNGAILEFRVYRINKKPYFLHRKYSIYLRYNFPKNNSIFSEPKCHLLNFV
jgi:hypothetical protein